MDCCRDAIGTVRFYQWCFAPLRGHAIDKTCHLRFGVVRQSNQHACSLCCCPRLVWCAVAVIAVRSHMVVGDIGEFLHGLVQFFLRPKFVQICTFVLQCVEVPLQSKKISEKTCKSFRYSLPEKSDTTVG